MEKGKNNRLGKIVILLLLVYLLYLQISKKTATASTKKRSANVGNNNLVYTPPVIPENPGSDYYTLAVSSMAAFSMETTQNTLNLNDLENVDLPPRMRAVAGVGTPGFTNDAGSGKLKILKVGITNYGNNNAYKRSEAPDETQAWFIGFTGLMQQKAVELSGAYPDLTNVTSQNFSAVSRESRLALGRHCYYARSTGYNYESETFDRSGQFSYYLLDEEQFTGSGLIEFNGEVLEGWALEQPDSLKNLFGQTGNYWWLSDPGRYPHTYSAAEKQAMPEGFHYNHPSFKTSKSLLDIGSYFKVPVVKSSIYLKDQAGNYLLNNGKRQFRTDSFQETIFGRQMDILAQPTAPFLQYGGVLVSPVRHEVSLMMDQLYKYYDQLIIDLMGFSKTHFGNKDISRWYDYQFRPCVTMRNLTEAWTYLGLSHKYREIGEYGILYWVYLALYSGIEIVESWDIGFNGNNLRHVGAGAMEIKPQGQKLFPSPGYTWDNPQDYWNNTGLPYNENAPGDDNFSRNKVYVGAVNAFAKMFRDCGFVHNSSLRFVRFNQYVDQYINKEMMATGLYQGTRFAGVFANPWLDETDRMNVQMKAGSQEIKFSIKSRKPVPVIFNVPSGLQPEDFTIKYKNIDNQEIFVNGLVTPNPANHYLS